MFSARNANNSSLLSAVLADTLARIDVLITNWNGENPLHTTYVIDAWNEIKAAIEDELKTSSKLDKVKLQESLKLIESIFKSENTLDLTTLLALQKYLDDEDKPYQRKYKIKLGLIGSVGLVALALLLLGAVIAFKTFVLPLLFAGELVVQSLLLVHLLLVSTILLGAIIVLGVYSVVHPLLNDINKNTCEEDEEHAFFNKLRLFYLAVLEMQNSITAARQAVPPEGIVIKAVEELKVKLARFESSPVKPHLAFNKAEIACFTRSVIRCAEQYRNRGYNDRMSLAEIVDLYLVLRKIAHQLEQDPTKLCHSKDGIYHVVENNIWREVKYLREPVSQAAEIICFNKEKREAYANSGKFETNDVQVLKKSLTANIKKTLDNRKANDDLVEIGPLLNRNIVINALDHVYRDVCRELRYDVGNIETIKECRKLDLFKTVLEDDALFNGFANIESFYQRLEGFSKVSKDDRKEIERSARLISIRRAWGTLPQNLDGIQCEKFACDPKLRALFDGHKLDWLSRYYGLDMFTILTRCSDQPEVLDAILDAIVAEPKAKGWRERIGDPDDVYVQSFFVVSWHIVLALICWPISLGGYIAIAAGMYLLMFVVFVVAGLMCNEGGVSAALGRAMNEYIKYKDNKDSNIHYRGEVHLQLSKCLVTNEISAINRLSDKLDESTTKKLMSCFPENKVVTEGKVNRDLSKLKSSNANAKAVLSQLRNRRLFQEASVAYPNDPKMAIAETKLKRGLGLRT